MVALHSYLFPGKTLRFVGFDEKPFYFNSSVLQKTLANRGSKRVRINESVDQSRERFTAVGACLSWKAGASDDAVRTAPDGTPCMAALFKVSTGEKCTARVRGRITPRDRENTLIQFAPKGSYRTENVLKLLDWALKPVASPAETVVTVLDWATSHCDGSIDAMLHEKNHSCQRIPGKVTDWLQVPDTHRHFPWSSAYKASEADDAERHWKHNPTVVLPSNSRQTVLHRAEDTWRDLRIFKATEKRGESCGEEQETQSERSDECDAEGGDPKPRVEGKWHGSGVGRFRGSYVAQRPVPSLAGAGNASVARTHHRRNQAPS